MNSTIKNLLIVVAIVLVLVAGLLAYSKYFTEDGKDTLIAKDVSADFPGREIAEELERIKSLRLEAGTSLFAQVAYQSLTDSTVTLQEEPAGRINPFAPAFTVATPVQR